jgi:hypothetical protein
MKKLYFLLFIFGFISLNAQDVNITFRANMNDTPGLLATDEVWVIMDDDWTEIYTMTDADTDGIYEYTLAVASGGAEVVQQYSYGYGDADWDPYNWETPPEGCRNDNWYREVTVPVGKTDTTLMAYYYATCTDDLTGAVSVTYQVDMSDVGDLYAGGTVWVNVNGDWSDWYTMADAGSGLYTYTKSGTPGQDLYYIFSYQNGADPDYDYVDEVVPAACGGTFGVRRHVVGTSDESIPVVKLGTCPSETVELVDITFSVDMSNETIDGKLVWQVIKSPWYWNELSTAGDDIYTGTVSVHKSQSFPYTFLLGDMDEWSGEESVPAECNYGTPTAPERRFDGSQKDSIMPVIVFGACPDVSDKYAITFQVDMSDISDIYADGYVWVNIDDWSDWYDMTDADEDDVYEFTAQLSEGAVINYIFSYQNGPSSTNDYVDETVPGACATDGQRVYTVGTADEVLKLVSFGSCSVTGVEGYESGQMNLYPNPVSEQLTVELEDVSSGTLTIMDVSGRQVISQEFSNSNRINCPVENLAPEIYIVTVVTEHQTLQAKIVVR